MQSAETLHPRLVGARALRVEDRRLVTGSGRFVDDFTFRDLAHVCILRSPYAHARITRVDVSGALEMPGVIGAFTGADAKRSTRPAPQAFPVDLQDYCLAVGEVVYSGQPVAAVVAETQYQARDAVERIEAEYEPLPAVTDTAAAARPGATRCHSSREGNLVFHRVFSYGDVEGAFASADRVVSDSLVYESYTATPLETYAIVAGYEPSTGVLTVVDNTQKPVTSALGISQALSIPTNRIRFVQEDIGGGFGVKAFMLPYEVLLSMLAVATRRRVKWVETRSEHLAASMHNPRRLYAVDVAAKRDGTILALKVRATEDAGAFARRPFNIPISCLRAFGGGYGVRAFEYDLGVVLTNKCPVGGARGNGKNHHAFMLEKVVDHVAADLGLPALQLRFKNLIPAAAFPYTTPNGSVYDSGDYAAALRRASEMVGYGAFRAEQEALRARGRLAGIGFALVLDPAASNSSQARLIDPELEQWGTSETASIHMDQLGNVTVALSSSPEGQGHETVAGAIVADELGVPRDRVTVFTGFDSVRNIGTPTSGTYSSRFASVGAGAVKLAAERLRERLLRVASLMMGSPAEALGVRDGRITSNGADTSVSLARVARWAYLGPPDRLGTLERSLDSVATYAPAFGRTLEESLANLATTCSYQAHAARVEVDPQTGVVKILKYVVVDDSGVALNPLIVEGQVHGGVYNGMAAALFERVVYDQDGQLLTSALSEYACPSASDVVPMSLEQLETPSPFTPTGAKGVGETGALGPQPAIMNAVEDALRHSGVRVRSSFLSSEDLHRLLEAAGTRLTPG